MADRWEDLFASTAELDLDEAAVRAAVRALREEG